MTTAVTVYEPAVGDTLFRRRGLLLDLRRRLCELEDEYRSEANALKHFESRYKPAVGARYGELERLREKIERAWDAVQSARRGEPIPDEAPPSDEAVSEAFQPDDELRKLFRTLARRVHPDLAVDTEDRERRHEFMAEATLAYRANDVRRLQWLFEHWQSDSNSAGVADPHSFLARTNRQIAWVRYRSREMHAALGELHASSLAEIKRESEAARSVGRNLILDLRRRVSEELAEAHRDLDRVRATVEDLDPDVRRELRIELGL